MGDERLRRDDILDAASATTFTLPASQNDGHYGVRVSIQCLALHSTMKRQR
jgi:hypothetical protein